MKELPMFAPRNDAGNVEVSRNNSVACAVDGDGCLTCGDVAAPVTVLSAAGMDAVCIDDHGIKGSVAIELVRPVGVGDRLLIHAGVAIEKLTEQ